MFAITNDPNLVFEVTVIPHLRDATAKYNVFHPSGIVIGVRTSTIFVKHPLIYGLISQYFPFAVSMQGHFFLASGAF